MVRVMVADQSNGRHLVTNLVNMLQAAGPGARCKQILNLKI